MKPIRSRMCIHEPDDWCVDCNPNCPNGKEQEPVDEIPSNCERNTRMSDTGIKPTKWRDPAGNVYSVEKSVKTGRFIVIRTNPGGNRKAAKQFETVGSASHVQKALDNIARQVGWKEVVG